MNTTVHTRLANQIECHCCGYVHDHSNFRPNVGIRCARCEGNIKDFSGHWLEKTLALTIAAAVFFVISNTLPFLQVELGGASYETTLLSGVTEMLAREQYFLGLLVLSTIFIFPLLEILSLSYLSLSYAFDTRLPGQRSILSLLVMLQPWSMLEIFLLSTIVALVKMNDFFTLTPGPALFCYFGLVFCMVGANRALNKHALWQWISPHNIFFLQQPTTFAACKHCEALVDTALLSQHSNCLRCHKPVHHRIPMSFQKTAALTIAAFILYIPANTFPMLHSTRLGSTQEDTILSGVLHLVESGAWVLALVVFTASILVPVLKIATMAVLLYSVKTGSEKFVKHKTIAYRAIEFIGRWSMVDVFVVILLVALVQFGFIANVEAGVAAIAFGAVVILTMLAAETFDSRLLWDTDR